MEDTGISASTPNLPTTIPLSLECLYVGRVFNSGLVVDQTIYNRWATMGPNCVNKSAWWCCEAQKYGQVAGTTTRVDFTDLSQVKLAWFKTPCNAGYNPQADVNLSGRVDFSDVAVVKLNWFANPGICP